MKEQQKFFCCKKPNKKKQFRSFFVFFTLEHSLKTYEFGFFNIFINMSIKYYKNTFNFLKCDFFSVFQLLVKDIFKRKLIILLKTNFLFCIKWCNFNIFEKHFDKTKNKCINFNFLTLLANLKIYTNFNKKINRCFFTCSIFKKSTIIIIYLCNLG